MAETIKAVKGFNQDMTCTPTKDVKFQYKEGETYKEEVADACNEGFHACELPMNVFRYYPPPKSVYHDSLDYLLTHNKPRFPRVVRHRICNPNRFQVYQLE